MTVEQRISFGQDEPKTININPGEAITTNIKVVEKEHFAGSGHPEYGI
jgi:hypothetical protein